MSETIDPFFEPYDREDIAYGDVPSAPLLAYLQQARVSRPQQASASRQNGGGTAIDLGAGAGRDTMALAEFGYQVLAVDLSPRGTERIEERAKRRGVADRVRTQVANVCDFDIPAGSADAICATTVLDHIPADDAERVWQRITNGLRPGGVLYVEVHTTEDPGSSVEPGRSNDAPCSETADAVINYFAPNQLAEWATRPQSGLRILRYEERLEWDYTHGPEHLHGKSILLAVTAGSYPAWYGQPAAFPRKQPTP